MDDEKQGAVLITKIEATRRQLHAAIRMYFMQIDELAVHTVAGAVFNLTSDILSKRKSSVRTDKSIIGKLHWKTGLFTILRDFAQGTLPSEVIKTDWVTEIIKRTPTEVFEALRQPGASIENFHVEGELRDWYKNISDPINFLKHADRDTAQAIDIASIDSLDLLAICASGYAELGLPDSRELKAFSYYLIASGQGLTDYQLSEETQDIVLHLRRLNEDDRKASCMAYINA